MKQTYRHLKKITQKFFPGIYRLIDKNKVIVKYLISGGTAAATDLGVLYVLTDLAGVWYIFSAAASFALAFFISFFLQKFWTFRDASRDRIRKQMYLYLTVALINLAVNTGGMYFLVERAHLWYMLAQMIMGGLLAIGSFLIYRLVIFKQRPKLPETKNNKIKVLIATGIFPPDIGGPATMLESMAQALLKREFEIKIITYSARESEARNQESAISVVRILKNKLFSRLQYFLRMKQSSKWADIIYVTDTYSVGYFAYLIKKITGKKYIVRFAGDSAWETASAKGWTNDYIVDFQNKAYVAKIEKLKDKRKKILVNADAVIAVSNFMGKIAQAIGVDENKIKIIYNSVDFIKNDGFGGEAAERIKKQYGGGKVILTACRLTPWKGVAGIIRIIPQLTAKLGKINFLVLGDGQELGNLQELAGKLGVSDRVYFLGKIKQAEMINYFKAADLFILNTNYEGLSHAILEAMAAGTPVLTTNAGGNPEVIADGQDGLLVNFNNQPELAAAAEKILTNGELADSLAASAKIKLKKFNWSGAVESTVKLLRET